MDRPGHRSSYGQVKSSEVLAVGGGELPTPSGVHEMQGKPIRSMVDLPDLRRKVGKNERRSVGFILSSGGAGDASGNGVEDGARLLPVAPPSSSNQAGAGKCQVGSFTEGQGRSFDDWENWLDTRVSFRNSSRQVFVQGKEADGTTPTQQVKEDPLLQSGLGDSGVEDSTDWDKVMGEGEDSF